jgi:hypothetical protein
MLTTASMRDPRDDETFDCPQCKDSFNEFCELCDGTGKLSRDEWMEYCEELLDYDQDDL